METQFAGFAPPPPEIQDLAEGCLRYVRNALQLELDYTPDTLPFLDHYIQSVPKDAPADVRQLLVPMTGAYFGEVVRRFFFDCRWHCDEDGYEFYRIEFTRCFLHFNPIGIAMEALTRAPSAGFNAHFQMLAEDTDAVADALDRTGGVRTEDYYRFTVRFEVLQQVEALLMARALGRGDQFAHFGPDAYDAVIYRA